MLLSNLIRYGVHNVIERQMNTLETVIERHLFTYLLYISISGFHILFGGIRMLETPPYSDSFQAKL